jgi:hypothetical protein
MIGEKDKRRLLTLRSHMTWFMGLVLVFVLLLTILERAVAQEKLQQAREIGEVYGRIYANGVILAGIVTNCENLSGSQGEFFRDYKKKLGDVYPIVGGLIKGVHSLLMEKRLGKDAAAQIEQVNLQLTTSGNAIVNQWFSSTDSSDRPRVCKNFENSIRRGDWDFFKLADQYFEILKRYDVGIYVENRDVQKLIEEKRALYKTHKEN